MPFIWDHQSVTGSPQAPGASPYGYASFPRHGRAGGATALPLTEDTSSTPTNWKDRLTVPWNEWHKVRQQCIDTHDLRHDRRSCITVRGRMYGPLQVHRDVSPYHRLYTVTLVPYNLALAYTRDTTKAIQAVEQLMTVLVTWDVPRTSYGKPLELWQRSQLQAVAKKLRALKLTVKPPVVVEVLPGWHKHYTVHKQEQL